ncbi:MAG: response regulator transcription factor [Cyanobacteria bacterium P01_A01_bin.83]
MINVLIADDQNFIRKTLESYLEAESDLKVIGFAENGAAAINQVEQLKPDIVLMDIEMPIMDGLTATKTIAQRFTDTKVLMLSICDREQDVAKALKLGAKGYWLKNTTAKELADAIRHVHKGYFQLALELVEKHFSQLQSFSPQATQDLELSNKLNMVDAVLAQVEQKIDSLEELTPDSLSTTVENLVKQEMSIRHEQDANLQFRFDRLRYQFNRLSQKTSLIIKTQLIVNLILLVIIFILGYFALFK